jgi:alpha-mannosidase
LRGGVLGTYNVLDPIPPRGQAIFSYQYGGQGWAGGGPVMAEMRVQGPFGDGQLATHIRLYSGLPRIEITTELVNQQPFVRYRNVFPLNVNDPHITYEIPFGAIERPQGEFPAQNWVDVSDGQRGVALLNQGIPGHALNGNVLTTSLMKCAQIVSYSGGGYNKEAKDSAGLEIGVHHRFEQALVPHLGNWITAQLYHEGMAFNTPLVVRKCLPHAGVLPSTGAFASIEPANLVLHALYVEKRQLVMRVAEAAGQAVGGEVGGRLGQTIADDSRRLRILCNAFRNQDVQD